ncbi:redoxin domain-containing protein [Oceanicaulis sp. UBA2681]|uniref:redoxin domain-containing protein n=1 Tax=Oceanicaulis sp. UBA2681 TaxID=1947007 RepID=UPI00257E1196|nr:redoxin domain-containing protein [Oceanicaulis sp. UBA2681]
MVTVSRRSLGQLMSVCAAAALTITAFTLEARADVVTGEAAPAFSVQTATGEALSLDSLSGQTVVLEWTNHGCPYVQRHYGSEHIQNLQASAAGDDVVWVQIISSAPGEQGYVEAEEALSLNEERSAAPAHVVLDPSGDLGRLYDARTTPHMYVIDGEGVLQYAGAIDDQPRPRADSPEPTDYVTMALAAVSNGQSPDPAQTQPYGCNVKYAY